MTSKGDPHLLREVARRQYDGYRLVSCWQAMTK
jgi:hypothetical protein